MAKVPYSSAVGSLMYAMVATRPDFAFAVGVVSRYMANPGKKHWDAVKQLLRYLKGTTSKCLCFGNSEASIVGYTDADYAGCSDTQKSTSGYVFLFARATVSWRSIFQTCTSSSMTESKYVANFSASKEAISDQESNYALLENTFHQLQEDFKYNLALLENRDVELEEYDALLASIEGSLQEKELALQELESALIKSHTEIVQEREKHELCQKSMSHKICDLEKDVSALLNLLFRFDLERRRSATQNLCFCIHFEKEGLVRNLIHIAFLFL
ncbi:hypothetical protein L7F22_005004 [Adiantum nelumboides]|nr:hypothetical protein [Adiantum nelumboides]